MRHSKVQTSILARKKLGQVLKVKNAPLLSYYNDYESIPPQDNLSQMEVHSAVAIQQALFLFRHHTGPTFLKRYYLLYSLRTWSTGFEDHQDHIPPKSK